MAEITKGRRGMGRGLAAILTSSDPTVSDSDLRKLSPDQIVANPRQPRRNFDDEALKALADSLSERGVLQPVLVRPTGEGGFELIAGERRWRAAQLAGLTEIPAIVREHDEAESLELALIENMAREDLNPVEEARACALLVDELGLTREQVGKRVGRSRVAVSNLMRLLDLPDAVLELLERAELSEGHGRALLMASDHQLRQELAGRAVEEGWSVRRLEEAARNSEQATDILVTRGTKSSGIHPDEQERIVCAQEELERAFGLPVKVKPMRKGYRVELTTETLEQVAEIADTRGVSA